ncbi:MAG: MazG nucleotide pyrophosphohydrolase domain-containing protein [Candidatus Hydrothermarchaeaceae archaeon]
MRVKEFQGLIRDLYFHRDNVRGVEKNLLWLVEEVGELSRAMRNGDRAVMGEEMADIVAWVMSIANIFELDVEELLARKYPGHCTYCGSNPCSCDA